MAGGWAYVGTPPPASGSGPTGSIQYHGAGTSITGSSNFMFYSASVSNYAAQTVVLSGTLIISGTISASAYHIKDVTNIHSSGSSKFGDSLDDTHVFTGSLLVTSSYGDPSAKRPATSFMTHRVGIGTRDPEWLLDVSSDDDGMAVSAVTQYDDSAGDGPNIYVRRARGTEASPTVVQDGDSMGAIDFWGHGGTDFEHGARIVAEVDGTPGNNDMPGRLAFYTTPDAGSTATEKMRITNDGKVGIGTTSPISAFEIEDGLTTGGAILTLGTKEPTVVANDVLGRINFYAPLETGADATAVAASVVAVAQDTFAAAVNSTSLQFQTGKSEVATTKMTINEDGYVGIGTTVPSGALHIQTGDAGVVPSANADDLVVAGATSTGVSVLTPNDQWAYYALGHPGGAMTSTWWEKFDNAQTSFGTTAVGFELLLKSGNGAVALVLDKDQNVTASAGYLVVSGAASGVPTHRVGIGTAYPSGSLHIMSGNAGVEAYTYATDLVIERDTHAGMSLLTPDAGYGTITMGNASDSRHAIWESQYNNNLVNFGTSKAASKLVLKSGNFSTALTLDANQNITASAGYLIVSGAASGVPTHRVGIGTVNPQTELHVEGESATTVLALERKDATIADGDELGAIIFGGTFDGTTYASNQGVIRALADGAWGNIASDTGTKLEFLTTPDGSGTSAVAMTILGDGNVGIGTTSPDTLLHLYSSSPSAPVLKIENEQGGSNPVSVQLLRNTSSPADDDFIGQIDFRSMNDAGTPEEVLYAYITALSTDITDDEEDGELQFHTMKAGVQTNTMTLQSGLVGIGTATPTHPLDVAGVISSSAGISGSHAKINGVVSGAVFLGDGSSLTGVASFPYTGHASITGSLAVTGSGTEPFLVLSGSRSTILVASTTSISSSLSSSALVHAGDKLEIGQDSVASGYLSTVAGGKQNEATADYAAVVGGLDNTATNTYSFVGAGALNNSTATMAGIVAGYNSDAAADRSFIGAGNAHSITALGTNSAIAGGDGNKIASAGDSFIGAGNDNHSRGSYCFIGSGMKNVVSQNYAAVVGGQYNTASNYYGFVGAGASNVVSGRYSSIPSGELNTVSQNHANICGGKFNLASAHYTSILGGLYNTASAERAAVIGGSGSTVSGRGSIAVGSTLTVAENNRVVLGSSETDGDAYTLILSGTTNVHGVLSSSMNLSASAFYDANGLIGGGTPGGSTGLLQYNNAGEFGGISEFSYDTSFSPTGRVQLGASGFETQITGTLIVSGAGGTYGNETLFNVSGKNLGSILFVTGSGMVGINSATPNHELAVSGNVSASLNVSGAAFYGGNLYVGKDGGSYPTVKSADGSLYLDGNGGGSGVDVFFRSAGASLGGIRSGSTAGIQTMEIWSDGVAYPISFNATYFGGRQHTQLLLDTAHKTSTFSGSVVIYDGLDDVGLTVTGSTRLSGSFGGGYRRVTTNYEVKDHLAYNYIIGVSGALNAQIQIILPSASVGAGHTIIIKDEQYGAGVARTEAYAITASVSSSTDLIDGESEYHIYGSMGSITLYSDGIDKWFVV